MKLAPPLVRFQFATDWGLLGAEDKSKKARGSGTQNQQNNPKVSYNKVDVINVCGRNFLVVKFNSMLVCGGVHSNDEARENATLLAEILLCLSIQTRGNIPCYKQMSINTRSTMNGKGQEGPPKTRCAAENPSGMTSGTVTSNSGSLICKKEHPPNQYSQVIQRREKEREASYTVLKEPNFLSLNFKLLPLGVYKVGRKSARGPDHPPHHRPLFSGQFLVL